MYVSAVVGNFGVNFLAFQALYDELRVTFLFNESDTIAAYEEQGKQKTEAAASSHQQGIDAFISSLGRVQQIELLLGNLKLCF